VITRILALIFLLIPSYALALSCTYPHPQGNFTIEFKQANNAFKANGATVWKERPSERSERSMPMGPEVQAWKLTNDTYAMRDLRGRAEYVVNFEAERSWVKPFNSSRPVEGECR